MKIRYRIWLILILIGIVLIGGCNQNKTNCVKSGGHWTSFSNSCVDSCDFKRGIANVCATVLTEGCDCEPDMCWNENRCELNDKN